MIGDRLKKCRKQEGVTQKELADILGLNQNTIASYETGRRNPSISVLEDIADLLNVSTDYLLGRDDKVS